MRQRITPGVMHLLCLSLLSSVSDQKLKAKRYSSPEQVISELWGITYHMGSHSVTCHPTQMNTPRPVLNLPTPEGQKAELT